MGPPSGLGGNFWRKKKQRWGEGRQGKESYGSHRALSATRSHHLARLKRDRPDLAKRAGAMSVSASVAVEAGVGEFACQQLVAAMPGVCLCALCRSSDFHIEIGRTTFRTMEEARLVLFVEEAKQRLSQLFLKSHRN